MNEIEILKMSADKARETMMQGFGGPFGAAIEKDGEIIALTSNSVLKDHDPTAHAEVNAIRMATKKLGTHDLSGCTLYATGYPCPMCLGATIWSNIKTVYVSGLPKDCEGIGFRDDYIYEFIKGDCKDKSVLDIKESDRSIACELYKEYGDNNKTIY